MTKLDSALTERLDANRNILSFPELDIELKVPDVAFTIGNWEIKWYGIIITLALVLAMIFGFSRMKKYGLDPDRAIDCVIGGIFGGIIGARLYYVFLNWDNFRGDWRSIMNIRSGGLAIYGGIIGAIFVAMIIAKIRRVHIPTLLDVAGMSFLIGQGIGRWGNFFNHEAFGNNTDLPWGMTSGNIRAWIRENTSYLSENLYDKGIYVSEDYSVHPCFLYESLWCLLGFAIIFAFSRKRKYDGQVFLMYIGWYGLGRFFIEGLRTDTLMIGTIRVSQALAAITFITAVILLLIFGSRARRLGTDCVLYKNTEESKFFLEIAQKSAEERDYQKANKKLSKNRSNGGESIYSSLIPDDVKDTGLEKISSDEEAENKPELNTEETSNPDPELEKNEAADTESLTEASEKETNLDNKNIESDTED